MENGTTLKPKPRTTLELMEYGYVLLGILDSTQLIELPITLIAS